MPSPYEIRDPTLGRLMLEWTARHPAAEVEGPLDAAGVDATWIMRPRGVRPAWPRPA
jgi:hypothetical protein